MVLDECLRQEAEIVKYAKAGNREVRPATRSMSASYPIPHTLPQAAAALAKQLIQLRKQKTRSVSAKSQLGSVSHQAAV